ncbi:MAG: YlbF family regulator [Spirochaetales bacterium]|nr:MAG: YlbF family regulator [Spirochaetales bacterium]
MPNPVYDRLDANPGNIRVSRRRRGEPAFPYITKQLRRRSIVNGAVGTFVKRKMFAYFSGMISTESNRMPKQRHPETIRRGLAEGMGTGAEDIREKTDELAETIRRHPLSVRHDELRSEINSDPLSRGLLARLIRLGARIDQTAKLGRAAEIPAEEKEELVKLLEANRLVRSYIEVRRELVALIVSVMEKIRNPDATG